MKHKTYILRSPLSAETTIGRVAELLTKAGVQHKKEGWSICSTSVPIVLLGFQRNLYSRRNWVGLNPFAFISGVDVRCRSDKSGSTEIIVEVNKFRTFLWVGFWAWCAGLAALGLPEPEGGIFFVAISLVAWFVLVSFLSGYLLKKEISGCLKAPQTLVASK